MRFKLEGIQYELKGLTFGPLEVIIFHKMEKPLKQVTRELRLKFILWKLNRKMKIFKMN